MQIEKRNTTQIHFNKYIEHVPSKPTTTSMRKTCNTVDTNNNEVAIEFSRNREHQRSASRTFIRLFMLDHKRQDKTNAEQ